MNEKELIENINILTEAVSGLLTANESLSQRVSTLESTNHELMRRSEILRRIVDNIPYELADTRTSFDYAYPKIEPIPDTIRSITEERKSLGRFGDGEFAIMKGQARHEFQRHTDELAERLIQVFNSRLDNYIIGIADNFGDLSRFTDEASHGIRMHMSDEMRSWLDDLIDHDRTYADGYITRFYALMRDNKTSAPKTRLDQLRTIWAGRKVIIVEGAETRSGVGNDLYANAHSIQRIVAPATNSYDRYDDILRAAIGHADEDTLFLIAIGPSAAILSYDLTAQGFQAVDIGHLDLEYEWFLAGQGKRVPVPGKYNNEVAGGNQVSDIHDPVYRSQIIANLSS